MNVNNKCEQAHSHFSAHPSVSVGECVYPKEYQSWVLSNYINGGIHRFFVGLPQKEEEETLPTNKKENVQSRVEKV